MTWVRVDDDFDSEPELLDATAEDVGVWLRFKAYANRKETDGFVPDGYLRSIQRRGWSVARAVRHMVEIGMLERDERRGGYVVLRHLETNPSHHALSIEREKRISAARKAGEASARARSAKSPESLTPSQRVVDESSTPAQQPANADPTILNSGPARPVPVPAEDPPLPPAGGQDPPRPRTGIPRGGALADAVALAYADGVSTATGAPYAIPHAERWGLIEAVHAHAPPELTGRAVADWTRERAESYARSHAGLESFERGFAPAKFRAWLNGGAKAPSTGRPPVPSPVQAVPAGGSLWRPGQDADEPTDRVSITTTLRKALSNSRSPASATEPHDDRREPPDRPVREPPDVRSVVR